MYEQLSHAILNEILAELNLEIEKQELSYFYTRLGSNWYSLFCLFQELYGHRQDFKSQLLQLVRVMANQYIKRPIALKKKDLQREKNFQWFLSQDLV
ncbi:MAG: alpha-amylase, partial [Xenococcus sp. (in: cyanobacteria)]